MRGPDHARAADRRARRRGVRQRHARSAPDSTVDFDVAEVDAEVAAARSQPRAPRPSEPRPRGAGRRLPDLAALPPLLAATEPFESLRERLGTPDTRTPRGRHAGLAGVPHGAKSYLAAALVLGGAHERLVWIARDSEIGDRVAEELGAWLGDADAVAVLEPRTSPGLRAQRAGRRRDGGPGRVACRVAQRARPDPRCERPGAAPAHDRPRRPADRSQEREARRPRRPGRTPARAARSRVRAGASKSPAGASSPAGVASSTSSRRRCRCRSGSSSSVTRSTRCARSIRPISAPSARSTRRS